MVKARRGAFRWVSLLILGAITALAVAGNTLEQATSQPIATTRDSSANPELVRRIGFINFYGLRGLDPDKLRSQLTFKVGDPIIIGDLSFFERSKRRLLKIRGVARAHVEVICCTADLPTVFVGIERKNTPVMRFRRAPLGAIRLPPEVRQAGAEFNALFRKDVSSGNTEEDDSEGHALLVDPAARPAEDRLIAIADNQRALIRLVLRTSADSEQRALAAQLLGYSTEKQTVVPDLIYAMTDSSSNVRNNAMRALVVFGSATSIKPPHVPYKPFIALLNSPDWTDRNKSSVALFGMTSKRDPILLKMLREEALPSLAEMARWSDREHAFFSFWILGYVAGLDEKMIADSWDRNDPDRVIAEALRP